MYMQMGDEMDDIAQVVADSVKSGDFWSAVAVMGGLSSAQIAEVSQKAIALGADPAIMAQIVESLGKTEVIEVTGKPPAAGSSNTLLYVAIGGAALWYAYQKKWIRI